MFSQSFESMINMVNIPPLVFFLLGSKDRRRNSNEKAFIKGIWSRSLSGLGFVHGDFLDLPICLPE